MRKFKYKYIGSIFLEQIECCRVSILLKKLLLLWSIFSLGVKAKGLTVIENIKLSQKPRALK